LIFYFDRDVFQETLPDFITKPLTITIVEVVGAEKISLAVAELSLAPAVLEQQTDFSEWYAAADALFVC